MVDSVLELFSAFLRAYKLIVGACETIVLVRISFCTGDSEMAWLEAPFSCDAPICVRPKASDFYILWDIRRMGSTKVNLLSAFLCMAAGELNFSSAFLCMAAGEVNLFSAFLRAYKLIVGAFETIALVRTSHCTGHSKRVFQQVQVCSSIACNVYTAPVPTTMKMLLWLLLVKFHSRTAKLPIWCSITYPDSSQK